MALAEDDTLLSPPPMLRSTPPEEYLTDEQLRQGYEKAYDSFEEKTGKTGGSSAASKTSADTTHRTRKADSPIDLGTVNILPTNTEAFRSQNDGHVNYLPLGDVHLNILLENTPVSDVVNQVVKDAAKATGPWEVRWRLNDENRFIMSERVNISAETNFDQFMGYLVDRINNMTGIQLFVRVFEASRVIVISDSY